MNEKGQAINEEVIVLSLLRGQFSLPDMHYTHTRAFIRRYKMTTKKLHLSLLLTLGLFPLLGQLQSPSDFFPHQWGEVFTPHHLLIDYFQHVEANSDQVKLVEYGRTNEGRPLVLAFISSPENLIKLEEVRRNNLKRAGILAGEIRAELDLAIVWISCTVHGNEPAGAESSPMTLYQLVDPENQLTQGWLQNTIVVLDPAVNPDGYSRYTNWYTGVSSDLPDVHVSAREHQEPWPGGRTNHYYYDLNRDWAWQTQIESQQRMLVYNEWLPHIHIDLHEQGVNSPYYFAPAAQPYHSYLTDWQRDFQKTIGKNHAHYFDAKGWLYFTKEVFDLLYPSYGDTYPMYNGSIGMTYEQGGGGRAGRAILMENGDTLTLKDRIDHHTTTSLSTIEVAAQNKELILDKFQQFFEASRNNPPGQYKSFIIKVDQNNGEKVKAFCTLLDRNGIKYGQLETSVELPNAFHYATRKRQFAMASETDLIISTRQPKGLYAQVLLEPETEVVDSLTYDITAWSLIYAYGLEAFASPQTLEVNTPFSLPKSNPVKETTKPAYAYLLPWNSLKSAQVLAELIQRGIKVRFAMHKFYAQDKVYPAGTLVVTRADNRKNSDFASDLLETIDRQDFECVPISTGFMEAGADLGSRSYRFVEPPKVGLLTGEGTRSYTVGQVWHFFDRELNYPIGLFDQNDLAGLPLEQLNTLILPDGNYDWEEETLEELMTWIESGGHLIVIGSANEGLVDKPGFNIQPYATETEERIAERSENQMELRSRLDHFAGQARQEISNRIPGAIFKNHLDNSHPLAFGLPNYYFSLKTSTLNFQYLKDTWNVATIGQDLVTSGFVGHQVKKEMQETTTFAVQEVGDGHITYLIDNPLFRSFWYNGKMVMSNALFLVGNE